MRMAELLESTVVDADGREIGGVDDVRLVQSGPLLEGFGAALVIDGLIVGTGSIAVRLGFNRQNVRGPALLKRIAVALESRARYVDWRDVQSWDDAVVRLRVRRDQLKRLTEVR